MSFLSLSLQHYPSTYHGHVGAIAVPHHATLRRVNETLGKLSGPKIEFIPYGGRAIMAHSGAGTDPSGTTTATTTTTPTSTKELSGPGAVLTLVVIAGVVVAVIALDVGIGYVTYKVSHWIWASPIIGFFVGGPVGAVAAGLGGLWAKKRS